MNLKKYLTAKDAEEREEMRWLAPLPPQLGRWAGIPAQYLDPFGYFAVEMRFSG